MTNSPHTIEIISDVSCPWCVIGYRALEQALNELEAFDEFKLSWRAFELNPNMPPEGQNKDEHLQQKYGLTPQQSKANRQNLIDRGKSVGYDFNFPEEGRVYNTFNAHRLIHWAAEHDLQTELKLAMFDLYFQQGGNPNDDDQLLACVKSVGLSVDNASMILNSNQGEREVRAEQALTQQQGVSAVPAFILDNKYLISGGQPKEAFVNVINEVRKEGSND